MKKYLFNGAMALIVGGFIVSCSHDDISQPATVDQMTKSFDDMFTELYGPIAPNHNWGFETVGVSEEANDLTEDPMLTRANTRTITVNGDAYNKFPSAADVNSHFPTGIPTDADDLPTNGDYNYYTGKGAGHNYVIRSAGTYTIGGGWQNVIYDGTVNKTVPQPYNVYVSVEGNNEVLIKHNGSAMHNLYILKGNVKLDSSVGEMANVVITVAKGATLTDTRDHIAARTDLYGTIDLYNKGTFYATNSSKYDMGNKARFYNAGRATITGPLTYSPADAENSFFINFGDDAVLTAPSMSLNSTGNFFNSGTTNIKGETNVTQKDIYWVNDGHYTTGTMTFSAKNTTFYNYCNLIVTGHANMYTGAFNLMDNSYTEVGSANLGKENFRINMGNNAGFNAKGNVRFEKNADNTEQGFFAIGTKAYVRIEGKAQVEKHKYVFVLDGNITYAIRDGVENLEALDPYYTPYSEFRSGTTEVKAEDFAQFTATPKTNGCGATWGGGNPNAYPETISIQKKIHKKIIDQGRVFCEDIATAYRQVKEDIDYNDIVFDARVWEIYDQYEVTYNNTVTPSAKTNWRYQYDICLLATGGTIAEKVGKDEVDVHNAFGVGQAFMVNTWTTNCPPTLSGQWNTPNNIMKAVDFSYTINKADQTDPTNVGISTIPITVKYDGTNGVKALNNRELQEEKDNEGKVISVKSSAPYKLCVPLGTAWPIERANIQSAYKNFSSYVSGKQEFWTNNIEQSNQYTFAPLSSIQNDKKTKDSPEEIVNDGNATSSTVMVVWDKAVSEQKTLRLYNFNFVNEQTLRFYGTGSFKVLDKNNQELFSVVFVGGSKDIKLTNYQASMLKENVTITSSSKFNLTKIVALDKF